MYCPRCHSEMYHSDGNYVCRKCGLCLSWDDFQEIFAEGWEYYAAKYGEDE